MSSVESTNPSTGAASPMLPPLATPRADLRTLGPGDVDDLFRIFADPRVTRYWSSPPLADHAAAEALLASIDDGRVSGTLLQWGLAERDGGSVIGTVTLAGIDRGNRRAEIGYALGSAHWGHGWMAEALPVVITHAFDTMGLHRLEADVDPRNEPSIHRLERLGFLREGLLRERWHVQGEVQDSMLYGLLAQDWRDRARGDSD